MSLTWDKSGGRYMPRVPVWKDGRRVSYLRISKITQERIYAEEGGYFDIEGKRKGGISIPREVVAELHKLVRVHGERGRWEASTRPVRSGTYE